MDKLRRVLALGAAAGMLASSAYAAVPAFGAGDVNPSPTSAAGTDATAAAAEPVGPSPAPVAPPSPASSPSPAISPHHSDAALADAVQRDLKLTPQQFEAAGELGAQAAAAAVRLRQVPGYVGIRIAGRSIIVTGSGSELQAAVTALAGTIHGLSLEAPPAHPSAAAPAAAPPSSIAPSATPQAGAPVAARSELAVSTEQLFQEYVREVGIAGLQAVVTSGGKFVIRTGGITSAQSTQGGAGGASSSPAPAAETAAPGKISPSQFVSRYANVELDGGAPLKPEADVPGGVGYQTDQNWTCSTGFSAFDPSGLPSVLTAGHCGEDGASTTATLLPRASDSLLGNFRFSQFGGPGNSPVVNPNVPTGPDYTAVTDPGNVGTDIAVIGAIRPDWDPAPAADTYGYKPYADKIVGIKAPVVGDTVCRSGWATQWSCGHIDAVGIILVGGPNYPADPNDIRAFNGFLSYDVQSSSGDSGGPWISGNYAVGTHSAGAVERDKSGNVIRTVAVAATLEDSLNVLPGYQLELFLNKPELTAPADMTFRAGTPITGRVPAAPASAVAAGSQVRITYAGRQPLDVPVQPDGTWSFTAPEAPGPFSFTAETLNGFNRSGAVSLDVVISPSFLPAPTITTPANQPPSGLTTVDGTGTPGATITLSGDVAGSALVGDDGHWTIALPAPAPAGKVSATAVQSYPGLTDSAATTVAFSVMPPPPAITSLSAGQHVKQDALPAAIVGTGLNGADVTVAVDGKPVSAAAGSAGAGSTGSRAVGMGLAPLALVASGTWQVPFPAGLATGTHTVTAAQSVDGVASTTAQLTFTVDAPPPVLPAGNITAGSLAATGASGLLTAAVAAAVALAVGVLLMVLVRRPKGRRT
ncbi:trypsin-like serine protease [Arthrobacter sp. 9AX]|uniref:trypsin-like serine protease n=1 Tax=Arthrobacter sp. 9AX TaxID=2653131 RepID=UPI0022A6DF07|nr:trypsin-like serine protease [Arthrobacter sp. 9AX]